MDNVLNLMTYFLAIALQDKYFQKNNYHSVPHRYCESQNDNEQHFNPFVPNAPFSAPHDKIRKP